MTRCSAVCSSKAMLLVNRNIFMSTHLLLLGIHFGGKNRSRAYCLCRYLTGHQTSVTDCKVIYLQEWSRCWVHLAVALHLVDKQGNTRMDQPPLQWEAWKSALTAFAVVKIVMEQEHSPVSKGSELTAASSYGAWSPTTSMTGHLWGRGRGRGRGRGEWCWAALREGEGDLSASAYKNRAYVQMVRDVGE